MGDNQYVPYDPEFVPEPFGLNNTGVICWLNSVLQVLLSCSALNQTIMKFEGAFANNAFAKEYLRLLKAILPNKRDMPSLKKDNLATASANILHEFVKQLRARGKNIRMGYSQECVDEAFILFIELFDCPAVELLFNNIYELYIDCSACQRRVSSVRDKSIKIDMFCNEQFTTRDAFCTYLRFHPSEHDIYKCDQCGHVMRHFSRLERLKMLREIVVITFNKYYRKEYIWFPQTLCFMGKDGQPLRYRLVGQIEHGGTMHGGHYTANALRDDKFYRFNDSSVSSGASNPTPNTYMIVYHMISEEQYRALTSATA